MAALAVEDVSLGSLPFAVDYLKEAYDAESVALVGASAGTGPVLQVAEEDPEEISQIIVLSGIGDVSGLGEYPKLFVASEGEGVSERPRQMAEEGRGDRIEALTSRAVLTPRLSSEPRKEIDLRSPSWSGLRSTGRCGPVAVRKAYRSRVPVRWEIHLVSSRRLWRIALTFQRFLVSRRTLFCCFP